MTCSDSQDILSPHSLGRMVNFGILRGCGCSRCPRLYAFAQVRAPILMEGGTKRCRIQTGLYKK